MRKRKKRQSRFVLPLTALALLAGVGMAFSFSYSEEKILKDPPPYPIPYSDRHITQNAIVSDPRFRETVELDHKSAPASVINFWKKSGSSPETGPERGTWVWTPILQITPSYRDSIIAGARENGINAIYLSIDSYLDIFVMEDGDKKNARKKEFDKIVADFIAAAGRAGIAVDAEAGWRNWAERGNPYKAFAVIDYVLEFNTAHEEKFRGFQYDVEPYLLDEFSHNQKEVLSRFLDLIAATLGRIQESNLLFGVVIPDFYDRSSEATPEFFWGWKKGYTLDHLLSILDGRPGSILIVMSYRNSSAGEDGSIEISRDEVLQANNSKTKVVIAQETGEVEPSLLTFHGSSRAKLESELKKIESAFAEEKSFNGFAIHYLNSLMALR